MEYHKWIVWYWVKYLVLVFLKGLIDIPFIIVGPIMLIVHYSGFVDFKGDTAIAGMWLCTIISCWCIVDFSTTLLTPIRGGGNDFPTFMENWDSWKDYKKMWRRLINSN